MKKCLLLVTAFLLSVSISFAQEVLGYNITTQAGNYSAITDGTIVGKQLSVETFKNKAIFPSDTFSVITTAAGFDIGFNFHFNGIDCNKFALTSSGLVYVGDKDITIDPTKGHYALLDETELGTLNCFGMMGVDSYAMSDNTVISYKVVGHSPNRQLVVQYQNINYDFWGTLFNFDFQIRLHETTNNISFVINRTDVFGEVQRNVAMAVKDDAGNVVSFAGHSFKDATKTIGRQFYSLGSDFISGTSVLFNAPQLCVEPLSHPSKLDLVASSTGISGFFDRVAADNYLILLCDKEGLGASPVNKTYYNVGDSIGSGLIISNSPDTSFVFNEIANSQTYYIYVYAYNSYGKGGPVYKLDNPLNGIAKTKPLAPTSLVVGDATENSVKLTVNSNNSNDKVLVVYTTELLRDVYGDKPLIGVLDGKYNVGDTVKGGGTVAYFGGNVEKLNIENLQHSTSYYFAAYSYNEDYGYSTTNVESSSATIIRAPYHADFANVKTYDLPVGWTTDFTDASFRMEKMDERYSPTGGKEKFQLCAQARGNADKPVVINMITSPIVLVKENAVVSFMYSMFYFKGYMGKEAYSSWAEGDKFGLYVSTDGVNFNELKVYTANNHPEQSNIKQFKKIEGDLSEYKNQKIWIKIEWTLCNTQTTACNIERFFIDTIELPEDAPTFKVSDVTYNSALITISGKYDKYQVEYGTDSTVLDTISVDAEPYILSDLDAETEYQIRVRGIEPGDKFTEWSRISKFITLEIPECPVPSELKAEFLASGVLLSWSVDESHMSWNIRYREASVAAWNDIKDVKEPKYLFQELKPGVSYLFKVNANGTLDRTSRWSAQLKITVPELSSSLNNLNESAFSVAVNNNNVIIINAGELIREVCIYSVSGQLVSCLDINSCNNVDIQVPNKGVYILKIIHADGQYIQKISVQ